MGFVVLGGFCGVYNIDASCALFLNLVSDLLLPFDCACLLWVLILWVGLDRRFSFVFC